MKDFSRHSERKDTCLDGVYRTIRLGEPYFVTEEQVIQQLKMLEVKGSAPTDD